MMTLHDMRMTIIDVKIKMSKVEVKLSFKLCRTTTNICVHVNTLVYFSGIPDTVPISHVNRQCSSGLQAFMNVAGQYIIYLP